ncbi:MAG: preprotein translocase subunit SecD [Haloferacaceae archaeon]
MIRERWRLLLLVVFVLAATFALFSPTMAPEPPEAVGNDTVDGDQVSQGLTNLQYGLDLAGGTRIRAPLVGYVADEVAFGGDSPSQVSQNVAAELPETGSIDVNVEPRAEDSGEVEVTDPDVTEEEFAAALDAAGYPYASISPGVTEETREAAVRVIEGKINEAGLSGGSVREVFDPGAGEYFLLVEAPGEDRNDLVELLQDRGTVRIDIYYPDEDAEDGYSTERAVLTQGDFENIGTAQRDQNDRPYVPVSVVDEEGNPAAQQFQQAAVEYGVAQEGGSQCTYFSEEDGVGETQDSCLLLVVDDEVVNAFGMQPRLASSMRDGSWAEDPGFRLMATDFQDAQRISLNLRAGALPAQLGIDQGSTSFISPTQGENFRVFGAIIGVLAVFSVAGMVFLRYRNPEVALPMIVTALSEVYILLGFAALVQYPVDLAVVAGFIAVVGTGVDDLVIIADEVMSEGEVNSRKVFDSRFRRAFWVIGAAAATTIIAMSPLMVLSLGDLSGFAIFTILGVLIGVFITRPAYGDILRRRLTEH